MSRALQYYCRRCDRWVSIAHTHGKSARNITRQKARLILHHREVGGRPLTEKQRRYFGARASGYPIRNGIGSSLWRGAKAGYHDYRAGRLEQKAAYHRSRATLNPRRTIPGQALEIRYLRSDGKHYFHPFEHNVKMVANRDGSVTLRGSKRVWANDGEPGFWDKYGHHPKRRNPVAKRRSRRQASGPNWLLIGAVGFIAYTLMQRGAFANLVNTGGQNILTQGAGTIWYSDPYTGGDSAFFTGSLPPGSSPPWRLASATEIGVRSAGLMTGSYSDAGGGLVAPNPGFLT